MTHTIKTSEHISDRNYLVTMTNGSKYVVFQSEALWWASKIESRTVVDCAPTKAELYRSLESLDVAA